MQQLSFLLNENLIAKVTVDQSKPIGKPYYQNEVPWSTYFTHTLGLDQSKLEPFFYSAQKTFSGPKYSDFIPLDLFIKANKIPFHLSIYFENSQSKEDLLTVRQVNFLLQKLSQQIKYSESSPGTLYFKVKDNLTIVYKVTNSQVLIYSVQASQIQNSVLQSTLPHEDTPLFQFQ